MKDRMFEWIEEVRAGERALKAKAARERRRGERELAGRELACLAKGRTKWRLTWCW
jgi:hypothetical protein